MNASHDQTDHVDRARFVECCGARDDSPSWNLGRARQGDTIRGDGTSPQGRGQEDVKKSEKGGAQLADRGQTSEIAARTCRFG